MNHFFKSPRQRARRYRSEDTITYAHPKPRRRSATTKRSMLPMHLQEKWTSDDEPYIYFDIDEGEAPKDVWKHCYDTVDKRDEELCRDLQDEISSLLVIAGLILGIITAFTVESYKWLQEDPTQSGAELLKQVVTLLNNTATQGSITLPQPFSPSHYQVIVNQLWFLAMVVSLSAVFIGTLCFQWLSAYRRSDAKYTSSPDALALRQVRLEGLLGWGVPFIPALLIMAVQAALFLFAAGLLYLLWNINERAALPIAAAGGVSVFVLASMVLPAVLPTLSLLLPSGVRVIPQCPFKSPWTWIVVRAVALLVIPCSYVLSLIRVFDQEFIRGWRKAQIGLLKGFQWEHYDGMWRKQWENRRVQRFSYYLLRGLTSVLETLGSHPTTGHIVKTGLQEFQGTSMEVAEVETFEELLRKDFTTIEKKLLSGVDPNKSEDPRALAFNALRDNFLNALMLQYLVGPNLALNRNVLSLRVELYIRIRNSGTPDMYTLVDNMARGDLFKTRTLSFRGVPKDRSYIGASLKCPVRTLREAKSLPFEIEIQFLRCVEPFVGTVWFNDREIYATALVLQASREQLTLLLERHEGKDRSFGDVMPTYFDKTTTTPVGEDDLPEINNQPVHAVTADLNALHDRVQSKMNKICSGHYGDWLETWRGFKKWTLSDWRRKKQENRRGFDEGDAGEVTEITERRDEMGENRDTNGESKGGEGGQEDASVRKTSEGRKTRRSSLEAGAGLV
ncbi:hypothetical protein D9756_002837 [Leucocoprinus leucothites]|uniref:DUF6535 domain-containing protein n=1 Tax=Leucocoprinus leucothites TaxID=201217 RepID=A0A8H5GBV5_9AGAR|nr:hypothetical protein D9756_002837 [Leucoagaricus leucothites]